MTGHNGMYDDNPNINHIATDLQSPNELNIQIVPHIEPNKSDK